MLVQKRVKTKIRDLRIFKSACKELGLNFKCEDDAIEFDIYGLSFVRQEDGSYEAAIGQGCLNARKIIGSIHQLYTCKVLRRAAKKEGYMVKESTERDGTVVLSISD